MSCRCNCQSVWTKSNIHGRIMSFTLLAETGHKLLRGVQLTRALTPVCTTMSPSLMCHLPVFFYLLPVFLKFKRTNNEYHITATNV